MIEIKKVEDPALAKRICEENNIVYNPCYRIIATVEGETIHNSAVFSYENEEGTIHVIDGFGGDLDLLDGLCRAILNIMDINGVKEVYLPSKYEKLAKYVGFSQCEDRYKVQLEGFFCCSCSSKKQ